jgi:hypothetical protein
LKHLLLCLLAITYLSSCKTPPKKIVAIDFVDSLINNYTTPQAVINNNADLQFWKKRIVPGIADIGNTSKYAAALISRFHLAGDIKDVQTADSVLQKTAFDFNGKESGPYFSLMGHCILQHRFKEADSMLHLAMNICLKQYETDAASFDVDFESGRMGMAESHLQKINFPNDYGYQFRKSKMMHYKGDLDASITAMQAAVDLSGQNDVLKLAALSNVGDLFIHAGKLDKAYQCFVQCVLQNPADLHSIMGIGWVALVKDKNDSLAERIFRFVAGKTQSPEPLFKLVCAADQRGDTVLQLKYALLFEQKASDAIYGNMYNKYLIQLYTGILHNPAKALAIAKKELDNRRTPQTNAWYAWAMLCNNKKEEAYTIYQKYISGKPLEGLELYYMGKLMQTLDKGYNAKQYFEQARKNEYDLSPAIVKDLQ